MHFRFFVGKHFPRAESPLRGCLLCRCNSSRTETITARLMLYVTHVYHAAHQSGDCVADKVCDSEVQSVRVGLAWHSSHVCSLNKKSARRDGAPHQFIQQGGRIQTVDDDVRARNPTSLHRARCRSPTSQSAGLSGILPTAVSTFRREIRAAFNLVGGFRFQVFYGSALRFGDFVLRCFRCVRFGSRCLCHNLCVVGFGVRSAFSFQRNSGDPAARNRDFFSRRHF